MDTGHSCKLLTLTLALLVAACSSNNIYRGNYSLCTYQTPDDCGDHALQIYNEGGETEYSLGFVEYDDQGQLRDPAQMTAVLNEYRRIGGTEDVLLVTFVHGWHHNASPEDTNVESFRYLLSELSRLEDLGSFQQNRKKRRVLGLYIGWRGESIDIPVVNNITFWDRKNTAHDVGQQGVTELLLKLEQIIHVRAGFEEEVPPPVNSRMVVIGHSFGGAVVFTSVQKILTDRFINSSSGRTFQGDAQGFGDLVVLMNPAFEALRYTTLYNLSQEGCRRYFNTQLPKLAILTSEADYATKYAFPVGRFFSSLFESHITLERHYCTQPGEQGKHPMQIGEGEADRTTVGHFTPYLTHRLNPVSEPTTRDKGFRVRQLQTNWSRQQIGGTLDFAGSQLVSLGRSTALNPYLNVQVDKALIRDHNDIWRAEIIAFIRDLIMISTTPAATGDAGQ